MQNEESKPKSMLEAISETPSNAETLRQGLLPESCEFHLETALTYARKAGTGDADALSVVIEHLEEIKEKIKKARGS